ncbi:nSTAND1 domain-containing NTPase [Pseudonocardia sp. TRM90224]|uniref:nSTAND1 domain-containing NTPase n=1 Tax=Pseudonocardia sp. TRM90224 TaxID=2812678 RepID=UPI001E64450E|nr:trypsin-like peptidase domain-containing protein [Pseudonocardia sp. TRM90224]
MTSLDHGLGTRVVVRVIDRTGEVVGGGFFVGPDLIATCAHVVATAVGADPYSPEAPTTSVVQLDAPLFRDPSTDQPVSITAEVTRWLPIGADGSGDIAILRLRGQAPDGARMPPLRRVDQLWDRPFRVLGFPSGMTDGVWATGRFRGEQATRWFQLQAAVGEQAIVEGFSGCPVWDEESGAVVGMTVATDHSGTTTTAYLLPIEQVLGVDPELLPCPYRGLEPFSEEHAPFFFGRDADIAELVDAVAERPVVAVTGPSGAGKSSLVKAGLVPRLRAAGDTIRELRPVPGEPPLRALRAALRPDAVQNADAAPPSIAELADHAARARTVLVVDQFEELAATDPETARELLALFGELVRALPKAHDGRLPVRVVLTLRSSTLDEVVDRDIAGLLGAGTVLLPPMDRSQLRDAIVAPAERAPGLSFEPGLVDRILDDAAAEPGRLPLVESLLTELWERRQGGYLTRAAYERAGGVAGVVATHAENIVRPYVGTADEPRLRRFFTALTGHDRDGRFVRRPTPITDLPADLQELVHPFAAGRLVVVERSPTGAQHVLLAHQALIEHWPRLTAWLTEDQDFLTWRSRLDQQREAWDSAGRDEGGLLRGNALAAAQQWLPARSDDVPAAAREYVRQSQVRQRREVQRWRVVTAVLAVLVLAAGVLAAVTVVNRNQINGQLGIANAELLGQAALARANGDPATAIALALAGWQADPSNSAVRTALGRLALGTRSVDAVYPALVGDPVRSFGLSNDGGTIAIRDGDGLAVLTGLPTGAFDRWQVPGVPIRTTRNSVSPDGTWLISAADDGTLWMWNVRERSGPARIAADAGPAEFGTVEFAPDGSRIGWLTRRPDGTRALVIWDFTRGVVVPHRLGPITDPTVADVYLTADPNIVLQTIQKVPGNAVDIAARSIVDGSQLHTFPAESVRSGRSRLVISCAPDAPKSAVIADPVTGKELRRIGLLTDTCTGPYLGTRVTADGLHLLEPRASGQERDADVARITSLTDGSTYDVTIPPSSIGRPGESPESAWIAVLPGPDQFRTVLVPRGSALFRVKARPDTGGVLAGLPEAIALTDDGQFEIAVLPEGRFATLDTATGIKLIEHTDAPVQGRAQRRYDLTGDLAISTRTETELVLEILAAPTLDSIGRYSMPTQGPPEARIAYAASFNDDHVAAMTGGLLMLWDSRTRQLIGQLQLGTTPERAEKFRELFEFTVRPGPVPQVAVLAPNSTIELWNPVTGKQEGALQTSLTRPPVNLLYDETGKRLVTYNVGNTIDVWDVEAKQLAHPPFLLPSLGLLSGFTVDGNLMIMLPTGDQDGWQLTTWDVTTGRQIASIRLPTAYDPNLSGRLVGGGARVSLMGTNGALPIEFPLIAEKWHEQLCAITNRPFTDGERALFPAGTDVERPCTD